MAKLILLLALLAFLYWGWRKLPPWRSLKVGRLGLVTAVAVVILLAAAGRLGWLLAAAGAGVALLVRLLPRLLPFLLRFEPELRHLWRTWRLKRSGVTRFVRLGADGLDGEILAGPFAGRTLASLPLDQVLAVYRECCQLDPDSALLLQAYLDRRFGAAWRRAYFGEQGKQRGSAPAGPGRMGREEAFAVLGLKPGASDKEIVAAHRRLMQKFHPDRGGSDDLAARINRAKDILLGKK